MEVQFLEGLVLARKVVEIASDKQATNIALLDVSAVSSFTDYFVICNGENVRQMKAIHDEVVRSLKKEGVLPAHTEGTIDSGWLLVDYGDVIVHIFAPFERELYQLDEVWNKANPIVRIQ